MSGRQHVPVPLLKVAEVANLLRTTPRAVYAMAQRHQLPGVIRIGRRLLFDEATMVKWLNEKRVMSPGESWR